MSHNLLVKRKELVIAAAIKEDCEDALEPFTTLVR
jgi:hypothetical protein